MILNQFHHVPALYRGLHLAKDFLDKYPRLYLLTLMLLRRNHWSRNWLISGATEMVIEGFPRSANSFAHRAFLQSQKRSVVTATHVHASAQVVEACRRRIPTLVLIREPRAAIVSLKALGLENSKGNDLIKRLPIGLSINSYISFYSRIYPYKDQFVLGEFKKVTSDFGKIIERVNHKFGTSFELFQHKADSVREVFDGGGHHLSPSGRRDGYKAIVEAEIEEGPNLRLLNSAREVYERLVDCDQD
jgi:hypothetical protein